MSFAYEFVEVEPTYDIFRDAEPKPSAWRRLGEAQIQRFLANMNVHITCPAIRMGPT